MTLGEFVDAINAELLRGGEFGKRRRPSGLNRRQAAEARARREMNQHYADLEEKEAFERWEASGMGVVEYIRARAEEGAPEFDLDWELAREVDRDNARGLVEGLEAAGLLPAARTAEDGDARAVREEMEELGLMSAARFSAGREYDEVVARYTNPDGTRKAGWMKAPNGRPTNLAERQWVQVRTPAFKRWFGDWERKATADASKVVDANGEPLVVYRGASFDPIAQNPGDGVIMGGAYFSPHPEYARRYGDVRAYYLNIRRPFDIRNRACLEDLQKVYPDHEFATGPSGALDWGEASAVDEEFLADNFGEKYDGLVYDEGGDGESAHGGMRHRGISYVPAEGGAQVKSATDNAGSFDAANPDIRFHAGRVNPNLAEDVRTAIAGDADGKPVGRRREVAFSEMPDALKAVGIPDLPIRTRTDIVRKLRRDHGFTERQIVALPEAYGQPAAVFIDGKAYVVLTGMQVVTRGGSEKPVMVVLRESVDRNGRHEFLASAYPREESNENLYTGLARSGKMLFLDKNKVAVIGLNGRTISTLNEQADGNRVKTPEDLSSAVSGGSMPNSGGGVNGGEAKFSAGRVTQEEDAAYLDAVRREYDEVVARYTNADGTRKAGWMKTPNGRPTNLTERKWVQVRTPAFKRWFGDWENDPANASKVVDANGEPLVVYHATDNAFTVFDRSRLGENTDRNAGDEAARQMARLGFWFNEKDLRGKTYQGRTVAAYADIKNPYETTFDELWDALSETSHEEFIDGLKEEGYDGIVLDDTEFGGKSFVLLEPTQVKSATDNAGAFDPANQDIRFHAGRVNPDEKMEMRARLASWLDPETLATARGLSRDEIFSKFGNALEPVSVIPIEYARLLDESIADNRVYSGRGYMVDHVVNHHPESDPTAYLNIQEIIDSPDDVKIDDRNPSRNKSLLFIKNVGASGVVIVSFGEGKDGKILLHKSFFDRVKKGRFDKYQSVKLSSVVGNPTISHAGKPAPAVRLSALEDTDSVPQSGGVAQGGEAKFAVAGYMGAERLGVKNGRDALAMEERGAGREEIWRATGWWRGADGRWRFEIPNARMKDAKELLAVLSEDKNATTLGRIMDAPELFKAYPRLKDTRVVLSPGWVDDAGGWYDRARNEIVIHAAGLVSPKDSPSRDRNLRSVYENVLKSDEFLRKRLADFDAVGVEHGTEAEEREYARWFIERQDRRIADENEARARHMAGDRGTWSVFGKLVHEVQHAVQQIEGLARGAGFEESDYERFAGEVEARNAARREAMSPEERAATPPWETEDVPQGQQVVRFAAGEAVAMDAVEVVYDPRAQVLPGGVRVAADAGRGERTPGGLASSRELSAQRTTPLSRLGRVNAMALPLSEMVRLYRDLTGSAVPPRVARRLPGGAAATHTRAGALAISADVLGLVDRTDAAKEKARLKEHGFFRDEDADWCATQLPAAVRAERERSDRQLGEQLRLLGERRVRGAEAGGHAAARGVFAHELAKVVMEMPRASTGVIGRVQKIGDGIRREVAAAAKAGGASAESAQRGEAGAFLDWAHGSLLPDPQTGAPVGRGAALSLRELTDEMFGAFLTMPQELHDRAPTWYDAIVKAVTDEPKLAKAYRELSLRGVSSRAHQAVLADIRRSMERATEARLRELESDANEPISAGSAADDAKEATLVALHDRMAPVVVRIDAKARICLKAKRTALRAMRARGASPSEIRLAEQEIDRYAGEIARLKGNIELSRTAYERGAANEGMRYFYRMLAIENEATLAGLTEEDKSIYLDQMRVIETQGRSGARGEDPQQARMILGDLARKLGPEKWAALERYGRGFSAVIEQEVLDNPGLARMLGKGLVDYMRTQVHYVATKRTFSVEELDAIDAARDAARAAGVNGGDDVVSQMYALMGKGGGNALGGEAWKKPLVGSFRDKVEPRAATWDKHEKIMQAVRRNELVIAMRDAFLATKVEGVRDVARVDRNKVRAGERYGYLDYMEDGQPRTLVVPKQIADAFAPRRTGKFAKALLAVNNLCRKLYIDFNLGYSIVDMSRNLGSIEKNMPGMHETPVKSALRAAGPGMAGLTQVVAQSLVKRSKTLQRAVDGLSVVPGFGNTVYQTMGDAHKVVGYLTDPTGFQLRLKEAKDRGDAAAEAEAYRIIKLAMEVMSANMFVSFTARQTGRATEGFANDVMNRHGLYTLAQEIDAEGKKSLARKLAESKWNVFRRNRQKIEYNDLFAKTIAYLHDRQAFGDVRTVQESGVVVKRNVGLGEVERRGSGTHVIQLTINQFFNAIEKGIVQHARALYERPVETILKDLNSWTGRFIGGLASTGVVSAALRALYDDDEDKVRASALGPTYDFLKAWERAHLNCSDYIRENYNVLPLWNSADGYTSVVLALPLDDQDRLFSWSAEQTAGLVAEKCGILGAKPRRSFAGAAMAATVKSLAPDLTFSTAVFDFVRVLFAQADDANPRDSFRGAPMYDPTVWGMRNESWEDRWDFTLATGKILWNAVGGRTFYQFGYEGVDNGNGDAPKWLGLAVNKIPVLSPTLKRFVKIQVGSPERDLRPLADEVRRVGLVVKRCRRKLMEESAARGGSLNEVDPKRYAALLEDWQRTYGLGDGAMSEIEAGFLNGWAELDRQDEVKRRKAMQTIRRAGRLGIEEADRYILGGQL